VASIVVYPIIGRLQDRFGDKIVVVCCAFCVVPLPLGWIFSTPGWLWPLFCTSLFAGMFWPGINQGFANISMARAPEAGKGAYLAAYGAVSGIGVVLSGIIGGLIAQLIGVASWQVAGVTINHYAVLFVVSMLLRFVAAMWVLRRL
jgi:MFS family permease